MSEKRLKIKSWVAEIGRTIFIVFGLTYFVFYFIDITKKGFISNFLSLNYILALFVISGVLYLIKPKDSD